MTIRPELIDELLKDCSDPREVLVMLLGWTGLQALGAWWSLHQDDVAYGRPRTAQYDLVVGHGDSASSPTHFIALPFTRSHSVFLIRPRMASLTWRSMCRESPLST